MVNRWKNICCAIRVFRVFQLFLSKILFRSKFIQMEFLQNFPSQTSNSHPSNRLASPTSHKPAMYSNECSRRSSRNLERVHGDSAAGHLRCIHESIVENMLKHSRAEINIWWNYALSFNATGLVSGNGESQLWGGWFNSSAQMKFPEHKLWSLVS